MSRRRFNTRRLLPLMAGIFVAAFSFAFLINKDKTNNADAADLSKFNPGNIISDYVMSNYNSMTEEEIQAWLTAKNPCNNHDHDAYLRYSSEEPWRDWYWKDDHFVCISEELFGDGMVVGEGDTAAHILYETAQEYKINPQVLIVLLQKESGLITDTIPSSKEYRTATGYGCPDTAACDSKYFGFKNQVRRAAALFREVLDGGWTNYPVGINNILYNPNWDCGRLEVNIQNLATSALYRYTPYTPNQAALNAGYGTGDWCSSYGNRNFYQFFVDWFGDPTTDGWKNLTPPKVRTIIKGTSMINPLTDEFYDDFAEIGEHYYFVSKIDIIRDGEKTECLRTLKDTEKNIQRCILAIRTDNFSQNISVTEKAIKQLTQNDNLIKTNLELLKEDGSAVMNPENEYVVSGEINISNIKYCILDSDINNGKANYGIPCDNLKDIEYDSVEFIDPTPLRVISDTWKYSTKTLEKVQEISTAAYKYINFSIKITVDGEEYYKTTYDTTHNQRYYIPAKALSTDIFDNFMHPRYLKYTEDASSINIIDGSICSQYKKGVAVMFNKKIDINGKTSFQPESENNTSCATPSVFLEEINEDDDISQQTKQKEKKQFVNFLSPRKLRFNSDAKLVDLDQEQQCEQYKKGDIVKFTTKIDLEDGTYYRTEKDTNQGNSCTIISTVLEEINENDIIGQQAKQKEKKQFVNFLSPRKLRFKSDAKLVDLNQEQQCEQYKKGDIVKFTTKIDLEDGTYYRTEKDTNQGNSCAVVSAFLEEI